MILAIYFSLFFLFSWLLTGLMRRYALMTNMLDLPNSRSSHVIPTPRGGGLAFVVCFTLSLLLFMKLGLIPARECYVVASSSCLVALLGFLDDHYQLSAKWRLAGHFAIATFAVYCYNDFAAMLSSHLPWGLSYLALSCAVVYLVWSLNLFNFMDGIDGIAAAQAICVCVGGALLYALAGRYELMVEPLLLAVAAAGFLLWNFPPARIFMGDVGSGFLGFVIAMFSLQAAAYQIQLLACWLILTALFISDATFTLIRRAFYKERLFEAHRSHAYQHAADYAGKHWPVTVAVMLINLVWILPLAILVQQRSINPLIGLVLAYVPLIVLAWRFNAGRA